MPTFLPAEWEPHEATWIAWPHNEDDWPGKMGAIPWVFAEMVRKLTEGERVRILIGDTATKRSARQVLTAAGVDLGQVEFFHISTDRAWTRDIGPMFVKREGGRKEKQGGRRKEEGGRAETLVVVDFRFNAWARYPNYHRDDRVARRAAELLGISSIYHKIGGKRFVLEGGAIDVNGRGTLLTTESCMLGGGPQARNPHLTREEIEGLLGRVLGVLNVFYLGEGIAGDDTGGHIDDFCRFAGPQTVVIAVENDPADENYRPLADARERLGDLRLEDGGRAEIVELPMPRPLYFGGMRLPASYANFYVANAVVLVPTFNDPADRVALGILADLFPGRKVVGIHAVDLVLGLGTIHCLTQQQPA